MCLRQLKSCDMLNILGHSITYVCRTSTLARICLLFYSILRSVTGFYSTHPHRANQTSIEPKFSATNYSANEAQVNLSCKVHKCQVFKLTQHGLAPRDDKHPVTRRAATSSSATLLYNSSPRNGGKRFRRCSACSSGRKQRSLWFSY